MRTRIATLKGKTLRYDEQGGVGGAETKDSVWHDYFTIGSSGRLFLIPYLTAIARNPSHHGYHEGSAVVDGHPCEVFSFVFGQDSARGPSEHNSTKRFYLDFQRGGHAIKVEFLRGHRLEARIVDVKLEQFPAAGGKKLWLPVYGRFEGLIAIAGRKAGDPPIYVDYPTNLETISIMKGSVKVNADPPDEHFRLRFKDGTLVKDGVTGKVIRSGKDVESQPAESLAQAQERLRRQIQEAEAQGKELRASSLARGSNWGSMTWIPWTIAVAMTAGLLILLARQRMGA